MKSPDLQFHIWCIIFLMMLFNNETAAQTILTLQPSAATGKDATISNFPGESILNFGTNQEFISESKSINFTPNAKRGLIQFDLSSIPSNATVISTYLSFYAYNLPGTGGHLVANNNTGYLFKVTQPWNESTVTWSTQPVYSTTDTIKLGISDSSNQDYLNIDIRNQIQDWVTTPSGNNGFLFKQKYECTCNGRMVFGSSDNATASLRPKLVVTYAVCSGPSPTATITPGGSPTICYGISQTLTANIGTGFTYQWFKNGTFISGSSSNSLVVTSSGTYTVKVTNPQGCTTLSAPTNLTVSLDNAQILTSWGSSTQGCANGGLTMNATAGGTGNTYNWLRDNGPVGFYQSSYNTAIPGNYNCIITNSSGTCTYVTNTIQSQQQVATMTTSGSNYFCTNASFDMTVQYVNFGSIQTYQWQQNGVDIPGATNVGYGATTTGTYRCIIDDALCTGNTISQSFDVHAGVPPLMEITSSTGVSPANLCNGQSVDLWLRDAVSGDAWSVGGAQWFKDGVALPANGGIPALSSVTQSGIYSAYLTTSCGVSTTPDFYVHSTSTGSTIPNIYPATTTSSCNSVTLSDPDFATDPWASYQWQKNNANIPGATSYSYNTTSSGNYRCLFGNGCGTIASNNTSITINAPSATITPQGSTTFCAGGSLLLNANTGTGYSYIWKKYGNVIPGATSSSYTATSAGVYKVTVTAPGGCSATSSNITVNVSPLPSASISASGSTAICPGNSITLNANTGTGLNYQWIKYSNNIAGATGANYNANGAGQYKVRVTNANGCSKNSNSITITTLPPPMASITATGPTTFCSGDSVKLSANSGAGLSYQWKKGSNNIAGALSANYYAKVTGNFKVTVTGSNGCSKNSNVIAVSVPCRIGNLTSDEVDSPFSIFPNPTNGSFTLQISDLSENGMPVEIYNVFGELVDSFVANDQLTTYSNPDLSSGIYFLTIFQNEEPHYIKLIISK